MELEHLEKQVTDVDKKVSLVIQLLQGNPMDKDDKGFVGVVNNLADRMDKMEDFKKRMIYVGLGLSIPSCYGIFEIIFKFVNALHK